MSSWYRGPERLRQLAWEAYEAAEHERLEIKRLWRIWVTKHGDSKVSRMEFLKEVEIMEAIEEFGDNKTLVELHTAMFKMELAWQKEVRERLSGNPGTDT